LIEWLDSFGCSQNWQPLDFTAPKPMHVRSVGWLAYDGDDCKVIVPHVSKETTAESERQGCGDMTIPSVAVLSILELKEP